MDLNDGLNQGNAQGSDLECVDCHKYFKTPGLLQYAPRSVFEVTQMLINQLSRHQKTHSRPYRCNTCDKGFALRADLNRHKTTHSFVKSVFKCKFPGCKFKGTPRKDNLLRHIRRFHGKTEDEAETLVKESVSDRKHSMNAMSLLKAAESGDVKILRGLIEGGADVAITSDGREKTALHIAALKGSVESIRLLLDAGANIEAVDIRANSALHDAARSGHLLVVEMLTAKGASLVGRNQDGHTPVCLAEAEGHREVVRVLQEKGANVDGKSDDGGRALLEGH